MQHWTCWKRRDYETVRNYIEHFKKDILEIVPHDVDSQELLWHFWKRLPYFLQLEVPILLEVGDMDVIFDHVVKVADALGITQGMDEDEEAVLKDWKLFVENSFNSIFMFILFKINKGFSIAYLMFKLIFINKIKYLLPHEFQN